MISAVVSISIITAKISSYFLEQVLKECRRIVITEGLNQHFLICGYKDDLDALLLHVLDLNPQMTSQDIVLVANLQSQTVELLRAHARLADVQIILGDYTQEAMLQKAAPKRARKILILADHHLCRTGRVLA
jgi:voltage-gated potassium channel